MMKQRKRHSLNGRRKSIVEGGIVKAGTEKKKRRATMGVIGDKVYVPGSPAMTLPELLKQAEEEVGRVHVGGALSMHHTMPMVGRRSRNPFETPMPVKYSSRPASPEDLILGEREWAREEWKLLDACFTDERLELGRGDTLASVDVVRGEEVVKRFVSTMGGEEVVATFGDEWHM